MRAISLHQPYASAMWQELKRNETRSWPTAYRGDLLICSTKRLMTEPDRAILFSRELICLKWWEWLKLKLFKVYGQALCIVEVYDCLPSEVFTDGGLLLTNSERLLGDYSAGRWVWMTRNCRPLAKPIPVIGRQRIWNVPANIEKQIMEQL